MTNIYIVSGSIGEWSDRHEWPVRAFTTESAAKAFIADREPKIREATDRYREADLNLDYAIVEALQEKLEADLDVPGLSLSPYDYAILFYRQVELIED